MKRSTILLLAGTALALAACDDFSWKCGGSCSKNKNPYAAAMPGPLAPGWQPYAGSVQGTCDNFDFGEPHYCINGGIPAAVGQTITLRYTTSGTGTLVTPSDSPPPRIALFLWRKGDDLSCAGPKQQYRYWGVGRQDIIVGQTQTLTLKIDPANFTDCYGKPGSDFPTNFSAVLSDLYAVGYTFGGANFAGHGVRGQGAVHFKLESFTIN